MSGTANSARALGPVVFVVDHFYPLVGGAETLFDELTSALASSGVRTIVVTQRVPRESLPRETRHGVEIHRVWVPPVGARLWFLFAAVPCLCRVARGAAVLHAGGYASMLPARLASWWLRVPAVATVFEVLDEQLVTSMRLAAPLAWAYRRFERWVMRLPLARFLCISRYTAERLQRVAAGNASRATVIYPAIDYEFWDPQRHAPRDLRAELGLPADARLCLFFGRPGLSKGIEALVEAARLLRDDPARPCYLVLLLAREPATGRRYVLDAVQQYGLSSWVKVLDPVRRSELPSYLLSADCVVIPSLSEGFGYSAIEAATLGCPVVGTTGHVFEEVLGGCATLVSPSDPARLAAALREVAWATDRPRTCLPQRFDRAAHLTATLRVYAEVTSAVTRSPAAAAGSGTHGEFSRQSSTA